MKPAQALSVFAIVSLASITSASTASAQQGQVSTVPGLTIPVLTIDEAVALAVIGNRHVRSTARASTRLNRRRPRQDVAMAAVPDVPTEGDVLCNNVTCSMDWYPFTGRSDLDVVDSVATRRR